MNDGYAGGTIGLGAGTSGPSQPLNGGLLTGLSSKPPEIDLAKLPDSPETGQLANEQRGQPDPELLKLLTRWCSSENIADDDNLAIEVDILGNTVKTEFDLDMESCSDYHSQYENWLKMALQQTEEKTFPWPGASNVIFPLITSAALQFSARAYPAIIKDKAVLKGSVVGSDAGEAVPNPQTGLPLLDDQGNPKWVNAPGSKAARAERIGRHMSWQLLSEQEEWEPQTDRLLMVIPIVGTMFRESSFDPQLRRNVSETIDATHLVVNYKARSFETAPRQTKIFDLYPWEIESRKRSGVFRDVSYGQNADGKDDARDTSAPVTFLAQHCRRDLDGDGYAEPYIVTIARDSGVVARIRAAWDMEGITWTDDKRVQQIDKVEYFTKYGFVPNPQSTVYDLGFGHFLFPINNAVNTCLNQMFDAGLLQNAGGGFVGSGLSVNTGAIRFQPGEFKPVNAMGSDVRDAVYVIPFPGAVQRAVPAPGFPGQNRAGRGLGQGCARRRDAGRQHLRDFDPGDDRAGPRRLHLDPQADPARADL